MPATFNASTKEVMQMLGLNSTKTLHRRRTDYKEACSGNVQRFLEPGIHFRRKSPDSSQLVWNLQKTKRAWKQAMKVKAQLS